MSDLKDHKNQQKQKVLAKIFWHVFAVFWLTMVKEFQQCQWLCKVTQNLSCTEEMFKLVLDL